MVVNLPDGLDVRIKTILEADEAASASRIKGQISSIEQALKAKSIKIPVEADTSNVTKSVEQSVRSATSKGKRVVVPVEAEVQVNTNNQYLKRALVEDFRRLKAQAGSLKLDTGAFESAFNTGSFKTARQELTILQKHLRAVSAESRSALPDLAITNFSKNVKDAAAQTERLKSQFKSLSGGIPSEVSGQLSNIRSELERLSQIPIGEATDVDVGKFKQLSVALDGVKNTLTTLKAEDKAFKIDIGAEKLQTDLKRIRQDLVNMATDWSAMMKNSDLVASRQNLIDLIDSGAIKSNTEVTALRKNVGLLRSEVKGQGLDHKNFLGQLGDNVKKFSQWFFIGGGVATGVRSFKEMINSVKAVDVQMTELRKVTDETNASYDKFFKNAKRRAVDLSTELDAYIGSVTDFSRMGYSISDSQTLADTATIYYNVGDGMSSMEDATQSIISTLKAYNLTADESARVTDIFNEVSNRFAVTSAGIGSGMQRAGAALATSNTSLEKSVALWTAMNEVIQNDESSATSLRFIAQRMRNTAGELEEMGEDAEGAAESVTKLQQQIMKLTGVNIMSDADTFRDVYDVLKDVSDVWDDITDKDRADVVRLMAGNIYALAA